MAAASATVFAIRNQAFRYTGEIRDSTTSNLIAAGLTGLALTVSKDGGTFAAAAGTVTEVATNSGVFFVEATAVDMACYHAVFKVTASNASAVVATLHVTCLDISHISGHWHDHTIKKFEQMLLQSSGYLQNAHTLNDNTGAQAVLTPDGVAWLTATSSTTGQIATKGKLS